MTNEEAKELLAIYRFNLIQSTSNQLEGDIEAFDMAIKALEQEPCEDCISRSEVLMHSHIEYDDDGMGHRVIYIEDIEDLPSVTPQQKVGKWIKIEPYPLQMNEYKCSECGHGTNDNTESYCSECGAKMEVEK